MSFGRSLATVSGLTVVSRVGGFVRDTLTAMFLGAGPVADAFFVAQRLPNLFRSLFAEGAFTAAFVPIYARQHDRHGFAAAQKFAGQALGLLLAILTPFSILMMLFMPLVMRLLAPGFENEPEKYHLAVSFSTITFPYLALISITALQGGVLNAQGRFGPAAAAPIAFNLVLIAALFIARYGHFHVGYALAWGVTVSGVVQMLWLMASCARAKASIPLTRPRLTEAVQQLFQRIGPGAVGAGASQINLLISTILASTLPTGAVSYLFYADRLNQLPLGIVGIAVATTLLPVLSRHVEAGREDQVRHYTCRAIEFCLVLGLPATLGLMFAGRPIVHVLFEHGAFSASDTVETAKALFAYSLGIPAFLLVKVFAAGFFARQDTKTPVKIAIITMIVNVAASLLLIGPLHHMGIALANALATWVNALLLMRQLGRHHSGFKTDQSFRHRLPRIVLSAVLMAGVMIGLVELTAPWLYGHYLINELLALSAVIGGAGLVYGLILHSSGAFTLGDLRKTLKRQSVVESSSGFSSGT